MCIGCTVAQAIRDQEGRISRDGTSPEGEVASLEIFKNCSTPRFQVAFADYKKTQDFKAWAARVVLE